MNKNDLRKRYLEKRIALGPERVALFSEAILKQFSKLNFENIEYLHLYYPIPGKAEFNSILLADWIREKHPEIKLVLSKSNLQDHTLTHYLWEDDTPLAMNQWGITEPERGITLDPALLDMVLVPLLAFDKTGQRAGYGKGFYDRFLGACSATVIKLGISFFEPEEKIPDTNQYDIPLDLCITTNKIWDFTG